MSESRTSVYFFFSNPSLASINDRTVPYVTAIFEPHDPFATYNGKNLNLFVNPICIPNSGADLIHRDFEEDYAPVLKSWSVRDQAEQDADKKIPKPKQTWGAWFDSKKPRTIPGPFIEWKFPLNLVSPPNPLPLLIHLANLNARLGLLRHLPDALPNPHRHGSDPIHTRLPRFLRTHKAARKESRKCRKKAQEPLGEDGEEHGRCC